MESKNADPMRPRSLETLLNLLLLMGKGVIKDTTIALYLFYRLRTGSEISVRETSDTLGYSPMTVMKHTAALEELGAVTVTKTDEGKRASLITAHELLIEELLEKMELRDELAKLVSTQKSVQKNGKKVSTQKMDKSLTDNDLGSAGVGAVEAEQNVNEISTQLYKSLCDNDLRRNLPENYPLSLLTNTSNSFYLGTMFNILNTPRESDLARKRWGREWSDFEKSVYSKWKATTKPTKRPVAYTRITREVLDTDEDWQKIKPILLRHLPKSVVNVTQIRNRTQFDKICRFFLDHEDEFERYIEWYALNKFPAKGWKWGLVIYDGMWKEFQNSKPKNRKTTSDLKGSATYKNRVRKSKEEIKRELEQYETGRKG